MDYGRLITRAFRITVRHRFLWILGMLAAFTQGLSQPSSFNFQYGGNGGRGEHHIRSAPESIWPAAPASLRHVFDWFSAHLYVAICLAVMIPLLMLVALFVVSLMAKGGLVASAAGIEKQEAVSFWRGMRAGCQAFWRLMGIWVLLALAMLAPMGLVALPVIALVLVKVYWAAVIVGLLFLPALIVLMIYLSVVMMYADRCAVLQTAGVGASLAGAHRIMWSFKKEVLFIWLIALGVGMGMAFVMFAVMVVIGLPMAGVGAGIYYALGLIPTVIFGVGAGLVLFSAMALVSGIAAAFQSSFWTLAYLDLTKPPAQIAVESA